MILVDHDIPDAHIPDLEQVFATITRSSSKAGIVPDDFACRHNQPLRLAPAERHAHVQQLHTIEPAAVSLVPAGNGTRALGQLARQALLQEAQIVVRSRDHHARLFLEGSGDLNVHRLHRVGIRRKAYRALAVANG